MMVAHSIQEFVIIQMEDGVQALIIHLEHLFIIQQLRRDPILHLQFQEMRPRIRLRS